MPKKCKKEFYVSEVKPEATIVSEVTQRFYAYQDATTQVKREGHVSDPAVIQRNLDHLISFIDPNFVSYRFDTSGQIFDFPTLEAIRNAYYYYATALYNGYSQHYAENVRVEVIPGTDGKRARLISGGGEYGSINTNFSTNPPSDAKEQHAISNWEVEWVNIHGQWYIHNYIEIGNRLIRYTPPVGPNELIYARQFPGAVVVPVVSGEELAKAYMVQN